MAELAQRGRGAGFDQRSGRVVPLPPMAYEPGPSHGQAISRPPVREPKQVKVESPHE